LQRAYKTGPLTLRDEHKMGETENRMLGRIFVQEGGAIFIMRSFVNLYSMSCIARVSKQRKMTCADILYAEEKCDNRATF
jgi:hypothetical protein